MKFSILTLFPEMFNGLLTSSILGRAQKQKLIDAKLVQIRDFALDRHSTVDDASFGGGPGMVMKVDVLERALGSLSKVEHIEKIEQKPPYVVYLSPQGEHFSQKTASRFAKLDHLVLVCGHYEGIDERFIDSYIDEELSLGDFVVTGGEIPAMAVVDAVARLLPGVIGDEKSFQADSFYNSLLDHPHYTRPAKWSPNRGIGKDSTQKQVVTPPDILLSGNHLAVDEWRRRQSLLRTIIRRPDLLNHAGLSKVEKRLLGKLQDALREDLEDMHKKMAKE
ncbi:MAG: tRNA (guanosine(37)-N1)-methyltransferase TrmD [Magnetococcales bacterium]|nr:tRNA (guanosine(37)-N1)-methyltransferase TrmD [Magnetococcales bacterium]